tara:strand:+ start:672 stop:1520 length:849 start_codon:yes stop_codon:yes gene_type:complete
MNYIISILKILRPLNIMLSLISAITAAFLIGELGSPLLPYAIITILSYCGGANILNDILDIHIDKINRPERILPSGNLKIIAATFTMIILFIIGIISSTYILPIGKIISLFIVLPLLILYTPILKKLPFIGNLVIGIIIGIVFIFIEGSLSNNIVHMWTPFFLATILSTIRELSKDAEDIIGDSIYNFQTFPKKFGLISTLWLLRFLSIILCLYAIFPWIDGYYGIIYLIFLIIGIIIPLFYNIFYILNKQSIYSDYSRVSKNLKGITIVGIFVILSTSITF